MTTIEQQATSAIAHGSKSFAFATRFFPEHLARAAHAVYWFCRTTDDLVDEAPSVEVGRRDLDQWEQDLRRALQCGCSTHPVLSGFVRAVEDYGIPHEYPFELIAGVRMDLEQARYETFDELKLFCYRVASVVGLMMAHVIGYRGAADPYAIDLGIAMQLTNILRDVGADLKLGRIYLPAGELERFGYSESDLRAHVRNESWRQLMRFQVARARDYYHRAEPGIEMLAPEGRFAVRIAADVYSRILNRIEAAEYQVFTQRAVVPAAQKYWLTARSLALPFARQSAARLGWRLG
jgi:phytoene synthase